VKLTDWLDEYRNLPVDQFTRRSADADDDWEEQELIASDDRVVDRTPRWRERAQRVGYGRITHF
jgi:hypothetical protein